MPELQRTFDGELLPVTPEPAQSNRCSECADCEASVTSAVGYDYCDECYGRLYTTCAECSAEVAVGEQYESIQGAGPFCRGCYVTLYSCCPGCGSECTSADMLDAPNNSRMCADCFHDRFTNCSGCLRTISFDDVAYVDDFDGDSYCCDCAPSDEDDDDAEWEQGRRVEGVTFDKIGSKRRFGVELEISGCSKHSGLRGQTPFGVKYDGSLSSGKEFVSPVLQGDEGLAAVENLCNYARSNDWTVDSSCGYHVHIDCGDLRDEQLFSVGLGYAFTADVWARFVANKRSQNRYCAPLPYTAESMRNWCFQDILYQTPDRYYWLNWKAYERHRTVEIRLHSGTTNYDKVANWVKIHARFVDAMAALTKDEVRELFDGKTVEEKFAAVMDIAGDDNLRRFYARRAAKHNKPVIAA